MEAALDRWCAGDIAPEPKVWAVWGYHLLTDIAAQQIVEDRDGVLAAWKERLAVYPTPLKQALIAKHMAFLRYWRGDYHYESKVERGDRVFLASLTARVVHGLYQVLYALNETYYVGDGWNDAQIPTFERVPDQFTERVGKCLYPPPGAEMLVDQGRGLMALIDDIEALLG